MRVRPRTESPERPICRWTKIPANAAQNIPEPASLLAWTLALGAVAYRAIRRSRACA